jgi:hypothetical protein
MTMRARISVCSPPAAPCTPPSRAVALHADGFDARPDICADPTSLGRDCGFEARAIEDEANVALGHAHLGSIGRAKYDARDATRDPWREDSTGRGVNEFTQAARSDAFAASHGRTDRDVAFQEHH